MIEWVDPVILGLGLVVAVGAFVQSSIGFGIAVVSAPFVVVLRPDLMPTSMLVCAFVLPVLQLASGPREILWRPLGWAVGARLAVTPLGVWLVASTSTDAIALAVGILILVTVIASVVAVDIRLTRGSGWGPARSAGSPEPPLPSAGPSSRSSCGTSRPTGSGPPLPSSSSLDRRWRSAASPRPGPRRGTSSSRGRRGFPSSSRGHLVAGPVRRRLPATAVRRGVLVFCVVASVGVIGRTLLL
uniref:Sulfite exporter TauE/SafE family protein n=1 Tax=Janibacter limosus TaxID=53458 RepID=A0AC61U0P8_9MICO|nr:sulfite exporter TauE/SafE family protein [Janibacter limosus]